MRTRSGSSRRTDMTGHEDPIAAAVALLREARKVIVFTGAGISVESGIPPFRGPTGLWSRYDPILLDIAHFRRQPRESWALIKKIFYDFFGEARPNAAHRALADMERAGIVQAVITQNIDNLHQEAGSQAVYEYHGTCRFLRCDDCGARRESAETSLEELPPRCPRCGGVLRPDFVFFGEGIPETAAAFSLAAARTADLFLVIGTTGEIMPASSIPHLAKENGAHIVEINPEPSSYTRSITDVFLQEPATVAMIALWDALSAGQ